MRTITQQVRETNRYPILLTQVAAFAYKTDDDLPAILIELLRSAGHEIVLLESWQRTPSGFDVLVQEMMERPYAPDAPAPGNPASVQHRDVARPLPLDYNEALSDWLARERTGKVQLDCKDGRVVGMTLLYTTQYGREGKGIRQMVAETLGEATSPL